MRTARRKQLAEHLRYREILCGSPLRRQIALTFDDGPHPKSTPELLAILKKYHVKGTFFVVGEQAVKYPNLVRDEVKQGEVVGNHTYHHLRLTRIPLAQAKQEVEKCGAVVAEITGKMPYLFRPPGGHYDGRVDRMIEGLGYTIVLWTDNAGDWLNPGTRVIERKVLARATDGGIVLCHDGPQQTLNALPVIITTLRRRGYDIVTVDQLMQRR